MILTECWLPVSKMLLGSVVGVARTNARDCGSASDWEAWAFWYLGKWSLSWRPVPLKPQMVHFHNLIELTSLFFVLCIFFRWFTMELMAYEHVMWNPFRRNGGICKVLMSLGNDDPRALGTLQQNKFYFKATQQCPRRSVVSYNGNWMVL